MPIKPPYAQLSARPARASTAKREYDRRRADTPELAAAARFRNSAAWQKLRSHFIAVHPICGACGNALARQVHHLEPIGQRPDLALDWDNLAPVCSACHSACNAAERRGEPTAPLFARFLRLPQFTETSQPRGQTHE